jgi:flagellar basal-body rod modification protein FlgD
VGRDVVVEGNKLTSGDDGKLHGGFEIASAADAVKVEILDGAGRTLDTLQLGAQGSGRHDFDWSQPGGSAAGATFRITATSGSTKLTSTSLMSDRISAVSAGGSTLQLQLAAKGTVDYDAIKAFN